MPFKIVQTQENNRSVLTVVPSNWEKDGVLFWPRKMNETKLIHNEYSMPGPDWKTMRCRTKRVMHSLEEANAESERMEQISDTENEYDSPAPTPRPRNKRGTHVLAAVNLNDQIAALNNNYLDGRNESSSKLSSASSYPCSAFKNSVQSMIINNDSAELSRIHSPTGTTSCLMSIAESQCGPSTFTPVTNYTAPASSGSLNSNTPSTFDPQVGTYTNEPILITVPSQPAFSAGTYASYNNTNALPSNQQNNVVIPNDMLIKIFDEQKAVNRKLAELQATVDTLLAHVVNLSSKTTPSNDTVSIVSPIIKPVNSRQELQDLEELLKNEQNFSATVSAMIFICGTSGKAKGLDCCYKLIDYFFTRDLLLLCSWTGTSRQNDKIPLKYFYNTRKCFLSLVRKADKDFSEQDCDKFFKTIIKNAKQRSNPKIMSAAKHRAKKITPAPSRQNNVPGTSQDNNNREREPEEQQENVNEEIEQVAIEEQPENINEETEQAANEGEHENRGEDQAGEGREQLLSVGVEQIYVQNEQ